MLLTISGMATPSPSRVMIGSSAQPSSSSSASRLGLPSGYGGSGLGTLGSAMGSGSASRPVIVDTGTTSGLGLGSNSGRPGGDSHYYYSPSASGQYRFGSSGPVRPSHPSPVASDNQQLPSSTAPPHPSQPTANTSSYHYQIPAPAPGSGATSSALLNMSSPITYRMSTVGTSESSDAHLNANAAMHRFSSFDSLPSQPSKQQSSGSSALDHVNLLQRGTTGLQELPSMGLGLGYGVGNEHSAVAAYGGGTSPGRRNASLGDISSPPRDSERERLSNTFKVAAGSGVGGSGLSSILSFTSTPAPAPALEPFQMPAELHASSNDLTSQILPSTATAVGGATSSADATHKHHLHRSFRAGRINSDSTSCQHQSVPQSDGQSFVSDSRSDVSHGLDQSYESQATFSFVAPAPECCIDKEREVRGTLDVSESVDAFSETLTPRAANALTLALHPPPDAKLESDPQRQTLQRSDSHPDNAPLTPRQQPDALALAEFQSLSSVVQRRPLSQVITSSSAVPYGKSPNLTSPTGTTTTHIDLTPARVAEALLARDPPPLPQHSSQTRKLSAAANLTGAQRPDSSSPAAAVAAAAAAATAGRQGRTDRLPLQLAPQPPPTIEVVDSRPKTLTRTRSVGPQRNSSAYPTARVRMPTAESGSTRGTPETTRKAGGADPKAAPVVPDGAIPVGIKNSMHRISAVLRERHKTIGGMSPARPAAKAEVHLGVPPAPSQTGPLPVQTPTPDSTNSHQIKRDSHLGPTSSEQQQQRTRTHSMSLYGAESGPSAGDKRFSDLRYNPLEQNGAAGEFGVASQTGAVDVIASERARGALKPPALAAGKVQSAQARGKATTAGGEARGSRKVAPTAAPGLHSRAHTGAGAGVGAHDAVGGGGSGGSSQATSSSPSSKEVTPTAHTQPQPPAQTQTAFGSSKLIYPPTAAPTYTQPTPTQQEICATVQSVGISQQPAAYSYTNSQTPFTQTFQPLTSNPLLPFPSVMLPSPPSTQPPPAAARSHTRAPSIPSVPTQPTPTYTSGIAADGGHYERPADTGGKGAAAGGTAGGDAEEEQRSSEYTTSSTAFDDATEASQTWEQLERDQPLVSPRVRVPHGGAPPKLAPAHADDASSARLTPLTAAHHESTDRLHNIEKFEDNMFRLYSEQKVDWLELQKTMHSMALQRLEEAKKMLTRWEQVAPAPPVPTPSPAPVPAAAAAAVPFPDALQLGFGGQQQLPQPQPLPFAVQQAAVGSTVAGLMYTQLSAYK